MKTGATYVLSENEGQDGGSQLRQEDEEDEHEKLQDKKKDTVSAKQSERPRRSCGASVRESARQSLKFTLRLCPTLSRH